MDLMVTLAPVFSFIQTWILGPIKTITGINSVITRVHKFYDMMKNMFKRKTDKEKKEEPCSSKDTSKRTKVKTVGKTTDNHTPHVSATGIRADRGEDVLDALKEIDELETVGQERGSADTVEATGIDLRRRQRRPEEGRSVHLAVGGENIKERKMADSTTGKENGNARSTVKSTTVGKRSDGHTKKVEVTGAKMGDKPLDEAIGNAHLDLETIGIEKGSAEEVVVTGIVFK